MKNDFDAFCESLQRGEHDISYYAWSVLNDLKGIMIKSASQPLDDMTVEMLAESQAVIGELLSCMENRKAASSEAA